MAPRTWTRSPDLRRDQLLHVATTLFSERGSDVTVADITDAAGVSKGTFYVYFASKAELVGALRDATIAEYHTRMAKAIVDTSSVSDTILASREVVGVSIDFLSSELHSILFPSAGDQAHGQREVVRGYEEFLIDANAKGIADVPDPYWFAVLLVGAANFAVRYGHDTGTFDRDALVDAIVELQRRALAS
jgi:AcrR family transcriptional regulator